MQTVRKVIVVGGGSGRTFAPLARCITRSIRAWIRRSGGNAAIRRILRKPSRWWINTRRTGRAISGRQRCSMRMSRLSLADMPRCWSECRCLFEGRDLFLRWTRKTGSVGGRGIDRSQSRRFRSMRHCGPCIRPTGDGAPGRVGTRCMGSDALHCQLINLQHFRFTD